MSEQALYTLPRDHRWHGDPFYKTSEYWEWHNQGFADQSQNPIDNPSGDPYSDYLVCGIPEAEPRIIRDVQSTPSRYR